MNATRTEIGRLDWSPRMDASTGPTYKQNTSIKLPTMAELRTQVVASTSGIALATVALNPLMIVKVRQQAMDRAQLPSVATIVKNVYRNEGIRAFWRGTGPAFAMAAPTNGTDQLLCKPFYLRE